MAAEFEWDEKKCESNVRKHGLDFADCKAAFNGYTVTAEDTRADYGEQRFVTIGLVKGRVISVVHTETGEKIRIISARKATRREQEAFFETIDDGLEAPGQAARRRDRPLGQS
jgi:uncharacterized DUF497 family protein